MNLRQLYYFKELAEQKQFLKAAKNLNISQPSLSNSLKSLEKELGCQLINRSGGQIYLTEYGQIFYKTAISSVNSLEKAKAKIKQQKLLEENIITIASIPTSFNSFVLPAISDYKKETLSTASFLFNDWLTPDICKGVRSGKFDFGICSKDPHYSDLTFIPLYSEQMVAIIKENNPLANKENLTLEDLTTIPIYTYSLSSTWGKNISDYLSSINKKVNINNTANDDISLISQIVSNDQLAIVANSNFLDLFKIKRIPISIPDEISSIYLVYNQKIQHSNEVKRIIQYLTKKKA